MKNLITIIKFVLLCLFSLILGCITLYLTLSVKNSISIKSCLNKEWIWTKRVSHVRFDTKCIEPTSDGYSECKDNRDCEGYCRDYMYPNMIRHCAPFKSEIYHCFYKPDSSNKSKFICPEYF